MSRTTVRTPRILTQSIPTPRQLKKLNEKWRAFYRGPYDTIVGRRLFHEPKLLTWDWVCPVVEWRSSQIDYREHYGVLSIDRYPFFVDICMDCGVDGKLDPRLWCCRLKGTFPQHIQDTPWRGWVCFESHRVSIPKSMENPANFAERFAATVRKAIESLAQFSQGA